MFFRIIAYTLTVLFVIWVLWSLINSIPGIKDGLVGMIRYLKGELTTTDITTASATTEDDIENYNETSKSSGSEIICGSIYIFAAITLLAAVAVYIYQGYQWLKTGMWVTIPLYELLGWFGFNYSAIDAIEWLGIRKVLLWILEVPLFWALAFLGSVIAFTGWFFFGVECKMGKGT